jgi:hypothetical protein
MWTAAFADAAKVLVQSTAVAINTRVFVRIIYLRK